MLTHGHADHVDGLDGALEERGEPAVLVGTSGEVPNGHPVRRVSAGDVLQVGPWTLRVLWPTADEQRTNTSTSSGPEDSGANDASVTIVADAGGLSVLLTGDLEPAGQEAVLRASGDGALSADVLKMPHHGSSRQSERFFGAVAPRVVTISAGKDNEYGHPAPAALDLLHRVGAQWWRTDHSGDIVLVLREGAVSIQTRGRG